MPIARFAYPCDALRGRAFASGGIRTEIGKWWFRTQKYRPSVLSIALEFLKISVALEPFGLKLGSFTLQVHAFRDQFIMFHGYSVRDTSDCRSSFGDFEVKKDLEVGLPTLNEYLTMCKHCTAANIRY